MVSADYLRVLRVTRVPASVRHNPDALMCLFSWFGGVQHVAVASDESGEAFVFFTTIESARKCLERVVETGGVTVERDGMLGKLCVECFAVPLEVMSTVPQSTNHEADSNLAAVQREGRLQVGIFDVTVEGVLLKHPNALKALGEPTQLTKESSADSKKKTISSPPPPPQATISTTTTTTTTPQTTTLPTISVGNKRPRSESIVYGDDGQQQPKPAPSNNNNNNNTPKSSLPAASSATTPAAAAEGTTTTTTNKSSSDSDTPQGAILVLSASPLETPNNSRLRPLTCLMTTQILVPNIAPRAILVCMPSSQNVLQRTALAEYRNWDEVDRMVQLLHQKLVEFVDPDNTSAFRFRLRAQRGASSRRSLLIPNNNDMQMQVTEKTVAVNGGAMPQHWALLADCNRVARNAGKIAESKSTVVSSANSTSHQQHRRLPVNNFNNNAAKGGNRFGAGGRK